MTVQSMHNTPGSHRDHLVGTEAEMFLSTSSMSCVDSIHQLQQLLNALVLTQVLTTFHQVTIFLFIIAANCYTLRTTNRRQHQHLCVLEHS